MDSSRPMEARFNRWPQLFYGALAFAAATLLVAAWVRGLDAFAVIGPLRQLVIAGFATGTALLAVVGVLFLRAAFVTRPAALAIDDRGVHFGHPDIGLVPWSRIERTEFFDLGGRRRFGVVTAGPAPRLRSVASPRAGFLWEPVEDGVRISLPLRRLDIAEAQIARTLRWFAPPVMRVASAATDS